MSVKTELLLLKYMLYVAQIIECQSIARAAQKNNIKASNLSKLLKDAENKFGSQIFIRTNKGLIPKKEAFEISKKANEIKNLLKESEVTFWQTKIKKSVYIYVSDDLEVKDIDKICSNVVLCTKINDADIIISSQKPLDTKNKLVVSIKNGDLIKQNLFISAKDTPMTKAIVTSIILMFEHK